MGLLGGGALIYSEPQLPHGSTRRLRIPSLSGLVDYSRRTARLFPNLMSDDLFNDHEAMFAVWQDLILTFAGAHEKDQYFPS
jgi:hypothetical protein